MRNGQPDRVPILPLAAEITAKYAGFTCQQVKHDFRMAFEAVIRCCRDFDWDAAVPNMGYVWTGLTQRSDSGITAFLASTLARRSPSNTASRPKSTRS